MGIQCGLRAISKLMQMLPKWNLKASQRICSGNLKGHYKSYHDIPEHILTLQCNIPSLQWARDNFSRILHLFTQEEEKKTFRKFISSAACGKRIKPNSQHTYAMGAPFLLFPSLAPLALAIYYPTRSFYPILQPMWQAMCHSPTLPTLWHRSVDLQLAAELWHWP